MNILLVEDDGAAGDSMETVVKGCGGGVVKTVTTLADARTALNTFDPDVMLTDLVLKDGDALELIREARHQKAGREVIVLTGHATVRSAVEAMKAGAYDFLLKPVKAVQLV